MRKINDAGLALIKRFEGLRLNAYRDTGGILTIGYGHTGTEIHEGSMVTPDQAEELLKQDLLYVQLRLSKALYYCQLTDNQYSALCSFAFNVGTTAFFGSTLYQKIQERDLFGAAEEFERWVYDNKKKIPGLVARRAAEKELFLS